MKTESPGRRAAAYWFSDGLPEMSAGLALTLLGAAGYARTAWSPEWWIEPVFIAAMAAVVIVLVSDKMILGVEGALDLSEDRLRRATGGRLSASRVPADSAT